MNLDDECKKPDYIPEIDRDQIEQLAHIQPIVRKDGVSYFINPCDKYGVSYTWEPKLADPTPPLLALGDITTYHQYSYYGFFKPSVAEVLACIPKDMLPKVKAFEIVRSPETADDFKLDRAAFNAGYHVATTRLYA